MILSSCLTGWRGSALREGEGDRRLGPGLLGLHLPPRWLPGPVRSRVRGIQRPRPGARLADSRGGASPARSDLGGMICVETYGRPPHKGPFAVRLHRPCVPGPVTTAVAGYDLCDATWTSRRGAEGLQRAARALLGAPIAVGGDDRLEFDRGLDLGDHVPGDHQRQGPALFRCRGDQRIPGTRTSSSSGTRVIAAVSSVTGDRSTWLRPPAWSMLR
jgi:hypothetical protein